MTQKTPNGNLVCPLCKGELSHKLEEPQSNYINCTDCDSQFPSLMHDHGVVAFFKEADQAIAQSYSHFQKTVTYWQNQANALSETLKKSQRKQVLLPILKAQHDNLAVFDRWTLALEATVKPSALLQLTHSSSPQNYGYSFSYLLRDWVSDPSSLAETNKILSGLKRAMRLSDTRGRACVLGMGTGRFALELGAYFDDIHGIDSSLGQLMQYHDLLERDISFWQIDTKNQLRQQNTVAKKRASIPKRLKEHSTKVCYTWGDALDSPYKDDFFDWVFSIYFSDVKPLPELIKEVKRVLRSGGLFMHCGPLEYHFQDIEHHYSFDEFRDYFLNNGFEFVHESSCKNHPIVKSHQSLKSPREYHDKVLLLRLK